MFTAHAATHTRHNSVTPDINGELQRQHRRSLRSRHARGVDHRQQRHRDHRQLPGRSARGQPGGGAGARSERRRHLLERDRRHPVGDAGEDPLQHPGHESLAECAAAVLLLAGPAQSGGDVGLGRRHRGGRGCGQPRACADDHRRAGQRAVRHHGRRGHRQLLSDAAERVQARLLLIRRSYLRRLRQAGGCGDGRTHPRVRAERRHARRGVSRSSASRSQWTISAPDTARSIT